MGFLPSGKELWDTWKSKNSASQLRTSMNSFNDQSNWRETFPRLKEAVESGGHTTIY